MSKNVDVLQEFLLGRKGVNLDTSSNRLGAALEITAPD
jgi:hypothetical protein